MVTHVKSLTSFMILFASTFVASIGAWAVPNSITFQSKIYKPNGTALEAASVNFRFTTVDPTGTCILYVEDFVSQNMQNSAGLIIFPLGSGAKIYPVGVFNFTSLFDNLQVSFTCQGGGTYSPNIARTDSRKIVLQFHDGTAAGWQTLPAVDITSVPYANYAGDSQKLAGLDVTQFLRTSALPTCGGGTVLTYDGSILTCVAGGGGGGGTVTSIGTSAAAGNPITIAGSASVPTVNIQPASTTLNGYLLATDFVTFNNKQSALGFTPLNRASDLSDLASPSTARTNLGLGTSSLLNVAAAGNAAATEVVKGNDTRITGALATGSAAGGDLSGTYPNPTLASIITAGTNTKITYDAKGRVTAGAALVAGDIPPLDTGKLTSGTLPIARGGTNSSTALTGGKVMVSNAGGTTVVEGMASDTAKSNNTFVMRDGTGNIAGALGTFDQLSILPGGTIGLNGATSGIISLVAPTAPTSYTFTLPTTAGTGGYVLSTNGSGVTSWITPPTGSLSGLTAATATNTIDNLNFSQIWNWSTATTQSPMSISANALTTGSLLNLTTSNATLNSTNGLLNVANTSASTTGMVARIQSNSNAGSGLTVLANGNVGVGTTSPAGRLDIIGENATGNAPLALKVVGGNSTASGSGGGISLTGGTTTSGLGGYGSTISVNGGDWVGPGGSVTVGGGAGNNGYWGGDVNLNGGNYAGAGGTITLKGGGYTGAPGGDVQINGGNGTTKGNILLGNTYGNVGIGTAAPGSALDLNGAFSQRGTAAPAVSAAGQGRIYFDTTSNTFKASQNTGAYSDIATTANISTTLVAKAGDTMTGALNMSIASDDNIIMSGNAAGAAVIRRNANTGALILRGGSSDATGGMLYVSGNADGSGYDGGLVAKLGKPGSMFVVEDDSYQDIFQVRTNGEVHFIDPMFGTEYIKTQAPSAGTATFIVTGNIGINVPAPQAALDVAATGITSSIIVPRDTTGNRPTTLVNGMIRYNTTTSLFEFYENGGWVNYTTVSDGRLKTNVTSIQHGLNIINQLNPVYFDWDQNNPRSQGFGTQHQVGFIAQEVEKVLPEVVNKGKDSFRSVEYGKIVSVVVAAVKELYNHVLGQDEKLQAQAREIASIKEQAANKNATKDLEIQRLQQENAAIKARLDKIENRMQQK